MSPRLDAHAHYFAPGYVDLLPASCRRRAPDEITLYRALAARHDISQVLAIGYEGESWAAGNNAYLAALAAEHAWLRPVAYITSPADLTVAQLAAWQTAGFVGVSFFLMDESAAAVLPAVAPDVWQWLAAQRWLVSVNSRGARWADWQAVLEAAPDLRVLVAHLGLPPAVSAAPDPSIAAAALAPVPALLAGIAAARPACIAVTPGARFHARHPCPAPRTPWRRCPARRARLWHTSPPGCRDR